MTVKPIAHSYWRLIKKGDRTFESVSASVKDDVRYLAKTDVVNGIISAEDYEHIIGEPYVADVA